MVTIPSAERLVVKPVPATYLFVTSRMRRTFGRVERRLLRVIGELVASGSTVLVICPPGSPFRDPARAAGATIAPYELDRFNLVRTRSRMRKYIKRYQPAVAHSTGYEADILLRWAASGLPVKVVSSVVCGSWPPAGIGLFGSWVRRTLDAASIGRCDALIVDCQELADRVVAETRLPASRVVLDPPVVNLARVTAEAAAAFERPVGSPLVGYAGALERNRGLNTLAILRDALAGEYPHLHVVVAGEGPGRASVMRAAEQGRLELLGHVPSIPAVLAVLDVCCFPATAPGTPSTLMEAAALGRPIVASAVAGIREMFTHSEQIVLVTPGDDAAFAAAVRGLLAHPAAARAMGERARLRVIDEYSSAATVQRHLALYARLMGATRED